MIAKTRPDVSLLDLLSVMLPLADRQAFEEAVATRAGARYALAFTYAHAGFYALLKALGWSGADIVLPAYTCDIMPEVVVATGNRPVFVDIDLADFNMRAEALKPALTPGTRMIVATHMFGYPTQVSAMRALAAERGLLLVEDAALSFPGRLQGDVGFFSFGPGKPLFTLRGGVMVTNDAVLYETIKSHRDAAMGRLPRKEWLKRWMLLGYHYLMSKGPLFDAAMRLKLARDSSQQAERRSQAAMNGDWGQSLPDDYATRYMNFQARLGLRQLRKADALAARRRALAEVYNDALREVPGLTVASLVEGAAYMPYAVRVRNRDTIHFARCMRERGIVTGHTYNYAASRLAKYRAFVTRDYPCAEQAGREVVNLPIHSGLNARHVQRVAQAVRDVLRRSDSPTA